MTFKICAVLGAQGIRATGFKRAQGNQHCAKSESQTNRVTFETNAIMMIVKVHPHCLVILPHKYFNIQYNGYLSVIHLMLCCDPLKNKY